MEYRFGPNKPNFTGTDTEWNELKKQIAWSNEDSSTYPKITVICPHCGSKNTHIDPALGAVYGSHRECDLMIDRNGKKIMYDCPGYVLFRYINSPRW
jgi:hypothetical protein